ncbi:MAG TPA: bifunctional hydroxymethylpyrimidine kinase/phosphomethylpyrimidine kinase [Candidatus Sumerlaeota bacterium]|nr:bifunctional hydroxymethylpyrimidine kinase/phosphomethylpyrimidine kinase [Candidatus Sumerlaeota bacterium]HNM45654.1 bifunctional hydroxymethylpyrimidine kinase/phosphomethylpyrimidine kinase [Candidatus Sumerlaeota bacterium]
MPNPRVLTIAGSDPSGGAGIQGDLKTITMHDCYGMAVITALTVQNTQGVTGVMQIPGDFIASQIDAVLTDIPADAIKTGMLGDRAAVEAVCRALKGANARNVVVDPVMIAKGGHELIRENAIAAIKSELFPLAELVTPNLDEVAALVGRKPQNEKEMEEAAREIARFGCRAVLVKGGHLEGSNEAIDLLYTSDGFSRFAMPRLNVKNTHGTGCALSAAIAATLAKGYGLIEAVSEAKQFVYSAIERSYQIGHGIGPLNHLWSAE